MFDYKYIRLKKFFKNQFLYRKFYYYYYSILFTKFINNLMKNGKKQSSLKVITRFFTLLKKMYKINPYFLLVMLVRKSFIPIELFKVLKSGRTYSLGRSVVFIRQIKKAIKVWGKISKLNKKKKSGIYLGEQVKFFLEKNKKSDVIERADFIYNTAIENQAYKHFRWRKRKKKLRKNRIYRRFYSLLKGLTLNLTTFSKNYGKSLKFHRKRADLLKRMVYSRKKERRFMRYISQCREYSMQFRLKRREMGFLVDTFNLSVNSNSQIKTQNFVLDSEILLSSNLFWFFEQDQFSV